MNQLSEKYEKEIAPTLMSEFGIKNKLAVPRIEKVIVNAGIGNITKEKEARERLAEDLAKITGQVPSVRRAKLSVAGFGIREGQPVGLKVTLRKKKMYAFLERLFSITLPRLRDFRGVPLKSFDQNANYTLGIKEHSVFPEIDIAKSSPRGLEVTLVTSTQDKERSKRLLVLMGMPFEKEEENG